MKKRPLKVVRVEIWTVEKLEDGSEREVELVKTFVAKYRNGQVLFKDPVEVPEGQVMRVYRSRYV